MAGHDRLRPALTATGRGMQASTLWIAERATPTNDNRAVGIDELHNDYVAWSPLPAMAIDQFQRAFDQAREVPDLSARSESSAIGTTASLYRDLRHENVGCEGGTAFTLQEAVERFFPAGHVTVRSLRTEIKKGRLCITEVAGKFLVTERAIAEMLEKCRCLVEQKPQRLHLRLRPHPRKNVWDTRDGTLRISTGCGEHDTQRAQEALARYIAEKYSPPGALAADKLLTK